MTDIRLRSFLAVARTGSFSQAADTLHVTQPAVSQHIQKLEEEYGVRLLSRVGRRTIPTQPGTLLLEYAESIEALYRSMERDMSNAVSSVRTFDVGATLTVAEYLLPPILGHYRKTNPHVRIRMMVQNTHETIERLKRNQLTLAIVEGPFEEDSLNVRTFREDELIVVCAPGHPWAVRGEAISAADLVASDLILREPGSGTRRVLEHHLMRHGVDPRSLHPYMEIGSINAIKHLVMSELGVTVISRSAASDELGTGLLVAIPLADGTIRRDLKFVWNDYSDASFVDDFLGFCSDVTSR